MEVQKVAKVVRSVHGIEAAEDEEQVGEEVGGEGDGEEAEGDEDDGEEGGGDVGLGAGEEAAERGGAERAFRGGKTFSHLGWTTKKTKGELGVDDHC